MANKIQMEDNTQDFLNQLKRNKETYIKDVAKFCGKKMDNYVPVDTGYLKSKNKTEADTTNFKMIASNSANYSGFVEKGTSKQREQPFLTPSIFNHINDIKRIAKESLGNGF